LAQKRELFRIAVDRTGRVRYGRKTLPCRVVNLTDKGFQLRVEDAFAPGNILHVEFPLTEQDFLACIVKVSYARPPFIGAVIVGISSHHQTLLSRFIDEINATSLMGF
jgi:PilZ domain-containing protein